MDQIIDWLLEGNVSIQYQTKKYILDEPENTIFDLQKKIATEGWGKEFLEARKASGHWGLWFYQPKWTCTHYTLMDMKDIGMPQDVNACREMVARAFDECMLDNGGINFAKTLIQSDVAIDGMILNYASYFCPDEKRIESLTEYIINQTKADGGYSWDQESEISDPHTTICVLEGFYEYRRAGFTKLSDEIRNSEERVIEWLLSNKLFISEDKRYRKLSHPYRYRYDILRVLEYLARNDVPYDERMAPSLQWLEGKKDVYGFWRLENIHKGNVHFNLEERGKPSRFITLKALFIQKTYRDTST